MQQAYVNAFLHLHQFAERSRFSTWLMRIALNEAFGRRRRLRLVTAIPADEDGVASRSLRSIQPDPERQAYAQELRGLLEQAIDALPEGYRLVFVLRVVEGLSTSETGEGLGLGDEVIKTRLHRARVMLRRSVGERLRDAAPCVFPFHATRCRSAPRVKNAEGRDVGVAGARAMTGREPAHRYESVNAAVTARTRSDRR